jgi:hypothetical protein
MLYWAYGSNLCVASMRRRCPDAKKIGKLFVDDATLVFRSVADVTVLEGSVVPGGLWEISRSDERSLDMYEGVASGFYLKRYLTVQRGKRKPEQVLFYQMSTSRGIMPPSDGYLDTIAQGYRDFGLPLEALDEFLAAAWSDKKVTPMLRERHLRKGRPTLARAVEAEA